MEDIVRGALAGIAIGGFAAAVVGANRITMQALWRFNCLAAEIAWVMAKAPLEQIIREDQQLLRAEQQRRRLPEAEDNAADNAAEDADDEAED